ncbi:MAG: hypothetical protein IAE79_28590 [Anaerolinea sp.]|nr:hypothetical protein [Anaerolinea sp.]
MRKTVYVSWRVAILFVLVWLVGASFLLGFWPFVRNEGEVKTVTNSQYGFSVDYPAKWVTQVYGESGYKGDEEIKLIIHRSLLGTFNIKIRYQPVTKPSLDDVVDWGTARIHRIVYNHITRGTEPGYEEVSLREINLRGETAIERIYMVGNVMSKDVYIARDRDMIIITFQAEKEEFNNYLEDFEAIVASFRPLD